jgi:hypothetical protein
VEQAAQCDRTSGLIGLNGISFTGSQDRGPWLGRTAAILTRHSPTDEWSIDPDNLSWFEIQYSDDVWTGDAYTYNDGASTVRTVGGDQKIRHLFTVHDADRHVDGVWLRAGRASQLDAGALLVQLQQGETVHARGMFSAEDFQLCSGGCGNWAFAPFDHAIRLKLGERYAVTFSAPDGAQYSATSGFPLDYSPYDSGTRNNWRDAGAQYSTDGGGDWSAFTGTYHPDRDLSLLFTIVGMPRFLPDELSQTSIRTQSWGQIKAEIR